MSNLPPLPPPSLLVKHYRNNFIFSISISGLVAVFASFNITSDPNFAGLLFILVGINLLMVAYHGRQWGKAEKLEQQYLDNIEASLEDRPRIAREEIDSFMAKFDEDRKKNKKKNKKSDSSQNEDNEEI